MFRYINILKYFNRSVSTKSAHKLELLSTRTLIRISGNEVTEYLQGLITNDMKHLTDGGNCMYTMFLNTKGRVLYDTIIYKTIEDNTFLIECDIKATESLQKHLKIYKLRKKIDITNINDQYSVYVIFNADHLKVKEELNMFNKNIYNVFNDLKGNLIKSIKSIKIFNDILIYGDPRMALLGSRIIAPKTKDTKQEILKLVDVTDTHESESYKWFRYHLGVGEGITDLPPEHCFPLESNCDYLHGISFHKGCYIGQELTARTYHTGVTRKRLMPLLFSKLPSSTPETNIINNNVNLGKLRGIESNAGLALLRISKSIDLKDIKIGDGTAITRKPVWWPIEAPKERISAEKSE